LKYPFIKYFSVNLYYLKKTENATALAGAWCITFRLFTTFFSPSANHPPPWTVEGYSLNLAKTPSLANIYSKPSMAAVILPNIPVIKRSFPVIIAGVPITTAKPE
jgi:hypothetical protein